MARLHHGINKRLFKELNEMFGGRRKKKRKTRKNYVRNNRKTRRR